MADTLDPTDLQPFDDLRQGNLDRQGVDLSTVDLRAQAGVLCDVTFDSLTRWPPAARLPDGFDPKRVLQAGKDPGLGVRALHRRGVTGEGVHVAVIDQPLLEGHVEYRDRLATYEAIECGDAGAQMHGPAVASLLAGSQCGTAPGAALHFWAEPMWKADYRFRTEALGRILERNRRVPEARRIRVVSVSKGFSEREPHLAEWRAQLDHAAEAGVTVVHCALPIYGVACPVGRDRDEPGEHRDCAMSLHDGWVPDDAICAPIDYRTTASADGPAEHIFWAKGGTSWAAPYTAGLVALAFQVNPGLTEQAVWRLLRETAHPFRSAWLVNPAGFVNAAEAWADP